MESYLSKSDVAEELTMEHLIDNYADLELIRRIQIFAPIYKHYASIKAVYKQVDHQKELIRRRKTELDEQIKYLQLVNNLLSGSDESSLLAEVLRSNRAVSPAQEAVLFHLLKTHWGKPDMPGFPYYAQGFDFFNEEQIVPDEQLEGYWLRLKEFNMFVPALQHTPVLFDPSLRTTAITALLSDQDAMLAKARSENEQLELFEKGQEFEPEGSDLFIAMDARLFDYAIARDLSITAHLVLQLDGKTGRLKQERGELQEELDAQLAVAGIELASQLAFLEKLETNNQKTWQIKAEYYNRRVTNDTATEKALRENSIPALKQQAEEKRAVADRLAVIHLEHRMTLEAAYPELTAEATPEVTEEELRQLQKNFDEAKLSYQSAYLSIVERFRETKAGGSSEVASELARQIYNFDLLEKALLGTRIRFRDQITEALREANRSRQKLVDSIHETMLKIFIKTKNKYEEYRALIRELNLFFLDKKISNKYFFQVAFVPSAEIPIDWINQLQSQSQQLYRQGELPIGESVENFVEDFFKAAVNYRKKIAFRDLLDPRTYFTLDAGLADENGKETSGSTGETYTAKVLLGIGRLSKVQSQNRPGIRFIILEETANLDSTNFNNFPAIADEFGYQIITMTPKPFGSDSTSGWYLHHLLPGKAEPDINYPLPASYFKTNTGKEELLAYLNRMKA